MQQSNSQLSQEESYATSRWLKFLWWLSTAEEELIKDCVVDRNRYAITGLTILCTWLFATFAWMYFFSMVTDKWFILIPMGVFMGFIILCIDRALIKGINSNNKRKFLPLFFRLLLAGTIGTFMAQPALLFLFKKEVKQQISFDNEFKKQQKLKQQEAFYSSQKQEITLNKAELQKKLDGKYFEVNKARENFISETDGTGGSKKIGLYQIAKTKKQAYELLLNEFTLLQQQVQPKIAALDSSLNEISIKMQNEQLAYNQLLNDGFLTQIEGLNNLIKPNTALQIRYWLLLTLLMLIELMPVIAKLLLPTGTYDKKVIAIEDSEAIIVATKQQNETDLKALYNQLAFDADKAFIEAFFIETKEKRKQLLLDDTTSWKSTKDKTYFSFWKQIKNTLLTQQEN